MWRRVIVEHTAVKLVPLKDKRRVAVRQLLLFGIITLKDVITCT